MGGSLSLLWQADGSAVAYLEGNKFGELIEDADRVCTYRLSYDQIRDRALSPPDSVAFIERLLEGHTMNGITELSSAAWRKSSYSDGGDANCVEIADGFPGIVPVRDSKNPHGPALLVPAAAWSSFLAGVRAGD